MATDKIVFAEAIETRWGTLAIPPAYATAAETNPQKRAWQAAYEAGFREALARAEQAVVGKTVPANVTATQLPEMPFTRRVTPAGWFAMGAAAAAVPLGGALLLRKKKKRRRRKKKK